MSVSLVMLCLYDYKVNVTLRTHSFVFPRRSIVHIFSVTMERPVTETDYFKCFFMNETYQTTPMEHLTNKAVQPWSRLNNNLMSFDKRRWIFFLSLIVFFKKKQEVCWIMQFGIARRRHIRGNQVMRNKFRMLPANVLFNLTWLTHILFENLWCLPISLISHNKDHM